MLMTQVWHPYQSERSATRRKWVILLKKKKNCCCNWEFQVGKISCVVIKSWTNQIGFITNTDELSFLYLYYHHILIMSQYVTQKQKQKTKQTKKQKQIWYIKYGIECTDKAISPDPQILVGCPCYIQTPIFHEVWKHK